VVSLLLLAFFVFLIYSFRVVIPPLILAAILAYILTPAANFFQARFGVNRWLSTAALYLVLITLLVLLPLTLFPYLAGQFSIQDIDIARSLSHIESFLADRIILPGGSVIDLSRLTDQFNSTIQTLLEPIFSQTLAILANVITSLVWIVFIFIVSFYLVKDGPRLSDWLLGSVPKEYRADYIDLRDEINTIWSAFFRGQIILAFVVFFIFLITGSIIGLPFARVMAVLAGLLEFLPSIGHGIWLVIASLLALTQGSTWLELPSWIFALIVIGLHVIFQQFDLNYMIPRIIGRRLHLPPLVVILGVVAGAAIFGFLGILLAAPTIASTRVIGRYIYSHLFDLDLSPDDSAPPLPPPDPKWWRLRTRNRRKREG
jgi:predicted PurR-regulated permease PerM